jgi:hypothetical protein
MAAGESPSWFRVLRHDEGEGSPAAGNTPRAMRVAGLVRASSCPMSPRTSLTIEHVLGLPSVVPPDDDPTWEIR